jgi:hypothetical protein
MAPEQNTKARRRGSEEEERARPTFPSSFSPLTGRRFSSNGIGRNEDRINLLPNEPKVASGEGG